MMQTNITNFHTSFHIPAINKLAFHIPHVKILGTNHCGDSRQTSFKHCEYYQDMLCFHHCSERVVAIFSIKYNDITIVEMYPCLQGVLNLNISVH